MHTPVRSVPPGFASHSASGRDKCFPLHAACLSASPEMVGRIVALSPTPGARDGRNATALDWMPLVCEKGERECEHRFSMYVCICIERERERETCSPCNAVPPPRRALRCDRPAAPVRRCRADSSGAAARRQQRSVQAKTRHKQRVESRLRGAGKPPAQVHRRRRLSERHQGDCWCCCCCCCCCYQLQSTAMFHTPFLVPACLARALRGAGVRASCGLCSA